jgi:hypothetical protein
MTVVAVGVTIYCLGRRTLPSNTDLGSWPAVRQVLYVRPPSCKQLLFAHRPLRLEGLSVYQDGALFVKPGAGSPNTFVVHGVLPAEVK